MANVDTDLILRKTLEHFKKSDRDIRGMLARSTVVWVQRWKPEENASPEQMKAGAGEWMTVLEGPLFIISRQVMPFYQMIVKPRSPSQQPVTLAVTKEFGFVPKKPNLHLTEDDSKESTVYNFHFAGDAEGSESFDRIVHVLQSIMSGAAHSMMPLVQMESSGAAATMNPTRMIKIGDLFPSIGGPVPASMHNASSTSDMPAPQSAGGSSAVPMAMKTYDAATAEHAAKASCNTEPRRIDTAGTMTATELLAKLTAKVNGSAQLTTPPAGKGHGEQSSVRNLPLPPPPVVDQPAQPPNIIAQLFRSTAAKAITQASGQQSSSEVGSASATGKQDVIQTEGQATTDQTGVTDQVRTDTCCAEGRRAAAMRLVQILLQDSRFLDAVADAMSAMSLTP
eukprot:jgi/Ulvmu1/2715/UM014_0172.1